MKNFIAPAWDLLSRPTADAGSLFWDYIRTTNDSGFRWPLLTLYTAYDYNPENYYRYEKHLLV